MNNFDISMLETDGFTTFPNFMPSSWVVDAKRAIKQFVSVSPSSMYSRSPISVHVHNPFIINDVFLDLFDHPALGQLLHKIIGRNCILRNYVASSVHFNDESSKLAFQNPIGSGWHSDSPFENLDETTIFGDCDCYQLVIALDQTNIHNSTKFLKGTHHRQRSAHRPVSSDNISNNVIASPLLNSGDALIFNDKIFHKAGDPTNDERYLLFIDFSPWYVKPYFDYNHHPLRDPSDILHQLFSKKIKTPAVSTKISNSFG